MIVKDLYMSITTVKVFWDIGTISQLSQTEQSQEEGYSKPLLLMAEISLGRNLFYLGLS